MLRFGFWVYMMSAIIFAIVTLRFWSRVDIGKHTYPFMVAIGLWRMEYINMPSP